MVISAEKTRLMTSIQREIKVKWQRLGIVTNFKYLGVVVSDDDSKPVSLKDCTGHCSTNKAEATLERQQHTSWIKVKLMCSLNISIFLYACESWTLSAELDKRAQASDMRCYRRLVDILYKDHVTEEEVRRKI